MSQALEDKAIYWAEDIAAMTGVPLVTIRQHCRDGKLRGVKRGKRWLITHQALREYLGYEEV